MGATPDTEILEQLFRPNVLRLLLDEGASDKQQVVTNLRAWPHPGFGAHVSREIPADPHSRGNVASDVAHPPILVDRIRGDPSGGKILNPGKASHPRHRAHVRVLAPLEFLAESSAHFPVPQ